MTKEITIRLFDEVKCALYGLDKDTIDQLVYDYSIFMEGYRFMVTYQVGKWDGKKQFFTKNGATYIFLLPKIIKKLKSWGYKKFKYIDERTSPFHEICPSTVEDDYFSHIINHKSNQPYTLTDHQLEAAKTMLSHGGGIALAGTGFGKAQPHFCKILTPTGWTTMGEIQVGDLVMTPKNTITRVLGTFEQGVTRTYKVTFEDGAYTYCHADHMWKIYNAQSSYTKKEPYSLYSTKQIIQNMKTTQKKFYVPGIKVPINFPKQEYSIDPYLVGSMLPFVELKNGRLIIRETRRQYDFYPQIILEDVLDVYEKYGISLKIRLTRNDEDHRHGILTAVTEYGQKLLDAVTDFIVNNKTLPDHYIMCAQEDRLRLLQGMCDIGGNISINGFMVVLVYNRNIKQQLMEMVSLQCGVLDIFNKSVEYNSRSEFVIYFGHRTADMFFTNMEKKKHHYMYRTENLDTAPRIPKNRKIESIKYHGMENQKCILVEDEDHLYITDYCLVTHNTILNAVLVDSYAKKGCKTLTIVPAKTLIKQTVDQFEKLGLDVTHYNSNNPSLDHDHVVTTWQTLQNVPHVMSEFQMVVVDECVDGQTLITMADNSQKPIKDVEIGDEILSYDNGEFEIDIVNKVHHNLLKSNGEKMYRLEFDNGVSLEVTGNHLIMTDTGYVRADGLNDETVIGF